MKEIELYIDGASKGNPGPSGIGVVICQDGKTIKNIHSYIGRTTNNVAEYTALIYGLEEALMLRYEAVTVNTDSQLLFKQLKGQYKIKSQNILGLYNQVLHLLAAFKKVNLQNIPRQDNRGADKLANLAVKEASKKGSLIKGQVESGCPVIKRGGKSGLLRAARSVTQSYFPF